jgi:hypothetical protein
MGREDAHNVLGECVEGQSRKAMRRQLKDRNVVQPTPSKARKVNQQQAAISRRVQRTINRGAGNGGRTTRGTAVKAELLNERSRQKVEGGVRTYFSQLKKGAATYKLGDWCVAGEPFVKKCCAVHLSIERRIRC